MKTNLRSREDWEIRLMNLKKENIEYESNRTGISCYKRKE
mgnify:FL=1